MGMCLDGQWYHLLLKSEALADRLSLDSELWQENLPGLYLVLLMITHLTYIYEN